MLRIHFTGESLARTRLATGPWPMLEVLLSLRRLGEHDGALAFGEWRQRVRARLPEEAERSLTGRARARADLELLAAQQPLPGEVATWPEGTGHGLGRLHGTILSYHRIALAPYWPQIQASVRADILARSRDLAHAGIDSTLPGLHRKAQWRPPVLEIPAADDDDLYLDGRGLLLAPSFFCWRWPLTLTGPTLAPVLVIPVRHGRAGFTRPQPELPQRLLAALLGGTRARILATVADGCCTTTQLAGRAGVSVASASQHATVLRGAGLISTRRLGGCVIHAVTPTGAALLRTRPDGTASGQCLPGAAVPINSPDYY